VFGELTAARRGINVVASDPTAPFVNQTGVLQVGSSDTATFAAQFTGDGQPHSFDLLFEQANTGNILGSIPVVMTAGGYVYHVKAIDPDGDPITYSMPIGQPGATFDPQTATLTWQPPSTPGPYQFEVRADDNRGGFDTQSFTVNVSDGVINQSPFFTSNPPLNAIVGLPYAYQVAGTDPDGDPLSYYLTNWPAGMTIDSTTGMITWTPTKTGNQNVTVEIRDGRGGKADQPYTINVSAGATANHPPQIVSSAPGTAIVGQSYLYPVIAIDTDGDPLTFDLPVHPDGMTVDPSTATIAWAPTQAQLGVQSVILRVQDGRGGVTLQPFTVTVSEPNLPPVITSQPVLSPVIGQEWAYNVAAQDAEKTDTLTYTVIQGPNEPNDMVFNGSLLTWKPTDDTPQTIVIGVDDGQGNVTPQTFVLQPVAAAPNDAPTISSTPGGPAVVGEPYQYQVAASDADGDQLNYQVSGPTGMTIDAANGLVDWIARSDQVGSQHVAITVDDGHGASVIQSFDLPVTPANQAPQVTFNPPATAVEGQLYQYQVVASDSDGDPLSYALAQPVDGATLSSSGLLQWTPTAAEVTTPPQFTAVVSDGRGASTTAGPVTVTVSTTATVSPPQFTSTPNGPAVVGLPYQYQATVTTSQGAVPVFSLAPGYPSTMSLDPNTGLLKYTPAAGDVGKVHVAITATAGATGSATQSFDLPVTQANQAPSISSTPPSPAVVGQAYQYQVVASDPDGDLLTYSLTSQPDGMQISASGLVTWTPSAGEVGSQHIVIAVNDGHGAITSQTIDIDVVNTSTPTAPVFDTTAPTQAVSGATYQYQVLAHDPQGSPLTFSLDSPAPGASIDPITGLLTWTNVSGGWTSMSVVATDELGLSSSQPVNPTVVSSPTATPPSISPDSLPGPAVIGSTYQAQITATDSNGDPVAYQLNEAPTGLTIDPNTGLITWLPTSDEIGPQTIVVQASDLGGISTKTYTLTAVVPADNLPPTITSTPPGPAVFGQAYQYQVTATDPDGDQLAYSLAPGYPSTMSLNQATGLLTWTPDVTPPASVTLVIQVDDGRGGIATQTVNLVVASAINTNPPQVISNAPNPATVGEQYQYQIVAVDPAGSTLSYALASPVGDLSVGQQTGLVQWTPDTPTADQPVTIDISDLLGNTFAYTFHVVVNASGTSDTTQLVLDNPPTLSLGRALVGSQFTFQLAAHDPDGDPITGFTPVNIPLTANLTSSGLITWTPDAPGNASFEFTVSDDRGVTADFTLPLEIDTGAINSLPTISSTAPTSAQLGLTYQYLVKASDPDGDQLTYSLDNAPAGMSIGSTTGLIAWAPASNELGDNQVQVRVTDSQGGYMVQPFTVTVSAIAKNSPPVITSSAPLAATVGRWYEYVLAGNDTDNDSLVWSLDQAPVGMSIDALAGVILWQPTADEIGSKDVTVRLADAAGLSVVQSFAVSVRGADLPPAIGSEPVVTATQGQTYTYAVRATDPEGDALTYSLAQKAASQMQIDANTGVVTWPVDANFPTGPYPVKIDVIDSQGSGVEQAYTLVVSAPASVTPAAPVITSGTPPAVAAYGKQYSFTFTATAAAGLTPTFTLVGSYPTGMSLNSTTGVLTWTPDSTDPSQAGPQQVSVQVSEGSGDPTATYNFTVTPKVDTAPSITSSPITTVTAGQFYEYDVNAGDNDGDSVGFSLAGAPPGMNIDSQGRVTWQTTAKDVGSYPNLVVTVTDALGSSVSAAPYALQVVPDTTPPKVDVTFSPNPPVAGKAFTLTLLSTDDVGVASQTVTVNGVAVALDAKGQAQITETTPGLYTIVASATDPSGNVGSYSTTLLVTDPTVTGAPTVSFTSPAGGDTIKSPTDILGTASDANLVYYALSVAPAGGSTFTEIARGTTSVTNAKLGVFDPTMLRNGPYILRLTAENTGGKTATVDEQVEVAGNLKLGNFHLSFTDLTIPVAGIPITVIRTYDSLQAGVNGDFGYGWSLNFGSPKLQVSLTPNAGAGWGGYAAFKDGAKVYVTMPDGTRQGFTFEPRQVSYDDLGLLTYWHPYFVPDNGADLKLMAPDALLSKDPDSGEYYSIEADGLHTYNPQDPVYGNVYHLVDVAAGTDETISASTGQIESISDRNGNTLNFSSDGIVSNSGRAVSITRDVQGRITAITDPRGNSVAYSYDAAGDLIAVTDRTGATTTLVYDTRRAHYLTQILDPYGRSLLQISYTPDNRLGTATDSTGGMLSESYDTTQLTQTTTDSLGYVMTKQFDSDGNVIKTIDENGNETDNTYNSDGDLTETRQVIVSPTGGNDDRVTTYAYAAPGVISSVTDPLGLTTYYSHDEAGNLDAVTDPLGNAQHFAYADEGTFLDGTAKPGDLLTETGANGITATFGRDAAGNMTGLTRADVKNTYGYDKYGDAVSLQDGTGPDHSLTYDANGNLTSQGFAWVNPTNSSDAEVPLVTNVYDANDRIVQTTSASGVETYEYDLLGRETAVTNSSGRTSWILDATGRQIQTNYPDGTFSNAVYDIRGRVVWETQPHITGRVAYGTHYTYDGLDNQLSSSFYANVVIAVQTKSDGSQASVLVSSDAAPLWTTHNVYNADGTLQQTTDASGLTTQYEYDKDGNQLSATQVVNGVTIQTLSTYDAAGNKLTAQDALGRVIHYVYNSSNQLVETIYPDGTSTEQTYDARGAVVSSTDQLDRTTNYKYDADGNLIETELPAVLDPVTQTTVRPTYDYSYDAENDQTSVTDPNQNGQTFGYDEWGRKVSWTLPAAGSQPAATETWTYDSSGRVQTVTDFDGHVTAFAYDSIGRVKTKQYFVSVADYNAGTVADQTTYAYDQYDASGKHDTVTDASGTTDSLYDDRGRLIQVTSPQGTIQYAYDPATDRLIDTKTSNSEIQYGYDPRGLLTTVTSVEQSGQVLATPQTTTYSYDAAGDMTGIVLPNGATSTYTYDTMNRVQSLEQRDSGGALLDGYYYLRDAAGNITTVYNGHAASQVEQALGAGTADTLARTVYGYDALDRLTSESYYADSASSPFRTETHAWDLASNQVDSIVTTASGVVDTTSLYDARNRLVSQSGSTDGGAAIVTAYDYDQNGSMIEADSPGDTKLYNYDVRGNLASYSETVTQNGQSVTTTSSYTYDDNGIRTRETVTRTDSSGTTTLSDTIYLEDYQSPYGHPRVIEERTPGGVLLASFVHGPQPISITQPSGESFYLLDAHSGVRHLLNALGAITDSYSYDGFGNTIATSGTTPNDLLYRGERFDAQLGQYYLRARYYDPATGRFSQMDPWSGSLANPVTLNKYLYANGDPIQLADPTGRESASEMLATISIATVRLNVETAGRAVQANQVTGKWLAILAFNSMILNWYTMCTEEPKLDRFEAVGLAYIQKLARRAFKTGGSGSDFNFKAKADAILQALAFQYTVSIVIQYAGASVVVHIKSNGFPDFTPFLYRGGTNTGFIKLTGVRSTDNEIINARSGYLGTPWLFQWHHHEVPGVMELVPAVVNLGIRHFGGTFYWELAYGQKYKSFPGS